MPRLMLLMPLTLFLFACDVGDSMREAAKDNPKTYARVLAADNGCMGCHAVSVTVVGPGWKMVAKKYANEPQARDYLINKIKKGGKGNWNHMTSGQSMPSYEGRMSDENMGILVDYILAL